MKPKKNEILLNRKKVIDCLRDRRMKFGTLKTKTGISESTLSRILKELKILGLAEKTSGYWTWYAYKKKYHPRLAEHAKKHLAPGLAALSPSYVPTRYTPDNQDPNVVALDSASRDIKRLNQLKEYALEHIRSGYPTIDNLLSQFRNLKSKLDKMQTEEVVKFVRKLEQEKTVRRLISFYWKKKPPDSWFRRLFPDRKLSIKQQMPFVIGPFNSKEEIAKAFIEHNIITPNIVQAVDKKWYITEPFWLVPRKREKGKVDVGNFLETRQTLMQVSESLAGEISKLLLKIEFGYHLDGECELCREIAFADTA